MCEKAQKKPLLFTLPKSRGKGHSCHLYLGTGLKTGTEEMLRYLRKQDGISCQKNNRKKYVCFNLQKLVQRLNLTFCRLQSNCKLIKLVCVCQARESSFALSVRTRPAFLFQTINAWTWTHDVILSLSRLSWAWQWCSWSTGSTPSPTSLPSCSYISTRPCSTRVSSQEPPPRSASLSGSKTARVRCASEWATFCRLLWSVVCEAGAHRQKFWFR